MKIIRKTMGTAISARPNYYQSRNNLSLKADFGPLGLKNLW